MGMYQIGSSREPGDTGAVLEGTNKGDVPGAKSLSSGTGRDSLADAEKTASVTQSVAESLRSDEESWEYWQEKAREMKHSAAVSLPLDASSKEVKAEAAEQLASEMKRQVKDSVPPEIDGMYKSLLEDSLGRVRWDQLAEDLLSHE